MSISVSGVSKFYGSQQALKNVSFQIQSGEVVGFLGPNGAGKSTMMKILTGYLPASSGDVQVCGFDVTANSVEFRRKVGYLPEHNPLYLDMYVAEYLRFIGSVYKVGNIKKRVGEMIDLTGLEPERHKKIGALSKGFRQRVGLAQALLPDPEVLILDEPTSGLDPNQIVGVRNLINDLGKSKTILLSTHIMQEVKAICERVIIIHQGDVVADEQPENLESGHRTGENELTVAFDRQPAPEQLITIDGVAGADLINGKWILRVKAGKEIRPQLFRFAVDNDLIIMELTQKQKSLEDVFQSLTIG
ncbi:gliding motility-associated ABC transporter ATP-binding subunit GldA [Natronoflexus pectinivorans]|uniref:ABC-2 type transport system ATP-binding protein n=1 Tax=Natronoflexus pectinivorans TaxID=682526 RepID=A0A4R2GNH5_9BACT|nr:gliding motility-associated ABC transporter ATP-binding subunit GldA [Natronoflexus pectinivorans]TCO10823.1 ABC-2 type transport system ATP-binding protein [Natronoflexus pectinivorans]